MFQGNNPIIRKNQTGPVTDLAKLFAVLASSSFYGMMAIVVFALFCFSCGTRVIKNTDHPEYFSKIIDSARGLFNVSNPEAGMRLVDSVYTVFPAPGIGDRFKEYNFKCEYYLREQIGEFDKALLYTDSMLMLLDKDGLERQYKKEYADANFAKGDVLYRQGKYNEAYKYYYTAKRFAEKNMDHCEQADFISRFGMVNFQQGKYAEAAELFKESYFAAAPCMTLKLELIAYLQQQLDNTGLAYYKAGRADSAMRYYHLALEFIDQHRSLFPCKAVFFENAKGVVYGNMGMVYYERGDIQMAENLIKKSILINSGAGNEQMDAQAMQSKLARIYLETARLPEARQVLTGLRQSLDTIPNEKAELYWRKLEFNYFTALKQTEKANEYLQSYLSLKDSADANDRKLASSNPMQEFQNLDQHNELVLLKKESEVRNLYLLITVLLVFATGLILFLIWRNWNRSKKNISMLTGLNRQISNQNLNMQSTLTALEQALDDNARLMKVLVHDLRNPIGAISSISALMLSKEDLTDEQRKLMKMIGDSSGSSLKLISEILEANTTPDEMKAEHVEMKGLLQYCVELLQFKAAEKKQQIILRAEPLTLFIGREKIWRVISNLIMNAIKFSPEETAVTVQLVKMGNAARISVQDRGIGIPDHLKDKIFEMTTEAKRTGTSGEQPFGLGLLISRKIVEAHGGRIWFESEVSKGTTFHIEFAITDYSMPDFPMPGEKSVA